MANANKSNITKRSSLNRPLEDELLAEIPDMVWPTQ